MDEEYDITLFSPSHDDPAVVELNSDLIHDYCVFAFQQLLIFHYDHEGEATAVKFLPSITRGPGADSISRPIAHPRSWKTQVATLLL